MIWFCVDSLNMKIAPEPPLFFLSSIIQTIFALKFELKTRSDVLFHWSQEPCYFEIAFCVLKINLMQKKKKNAKALNVGPPSSQTMEGKSNYCRQDKFLKYAFLP